MIVELAALAALAGMAAGIPVGGKIKGAKVLGHLESRMRREADAAASRHWRLEEQRQAGLREEKELHELHLRLADKELLKTQHERDAAAAALLAEQNRAGELEGEKRRIREEELRQSAIRLKLTERLCRAVRRRNQIAALEAGIKVKALRVESMRLEAVIAETRQLELEGQKRQEKELLTVRLRELIVSSGFGGMITHHKLVSLYLDELKQVAGLEIGSVSKTLTDLLIMLELPSEGPYMLPLQEEETTYSTRGIALWRGPSLKESMSVWRRDVGGLGAKTITRMQSDSGPHIVVIANRQLDYVRWEMSLLSKSTIRAQVTRAVLPSTDPDELMSTFIGLFEDLLTVLQGKETCKQKAGR